MLIEMNNSIKWTVYTSRRLPQEIETKRSYLLLNVAGLGFFETVND